MNNKSLETKRKIKNYFIKKINGGNKIVFRQGVGKLKFSDLNIQ